MRGGVEKVEILVWNKSSGIGIECTSSSMESFLFGISSTTFRKVSAISFKYYYHGWIYITDFLCYLLFGFHDLTFYSTKIQNNIF